MVGTMEIGPSRFPTAILFLLTLIPSCASTSGTVSATPVAVGPEWITLTPKTRIKGDRRGSIRVEVSRDDEPDGTSFDGCIIRHSGRVVQVRVQVLQDSGSWQEAECDGVAFTDFQQFLVFSLSELNASYKTIRIRASEEIPIPSIIWGRSYDLVW